nr:DUF637 domain-containing protein [Pseudomonas fluorescens]
MQKKGGFGGSSQTKRDEITDVNNIGSEITTGGDLTLVSGGDQRYQGAKLNSGNDLTLDSGGGITFEAVKDLHQESHEKSKGDLAWNSASGKGQTDETLRQSELIANGKTVINAVDGLHIDLKQIDQKSVSETIDAMVQADPNLAWLKEADARGDVDWRAVKELHDSYSYSHSGLGQGAMLVIAIVVTVLTYGAASAAIGAGAASGSALSAGAAATATSEAVAAGWANIALASGAASLASTGAVSTINNHGNIGRALSDTFSSDSIKQAMIAASVAGFMAAYGPEWFGGKTDPSTNTTTATGSGIGAIPDITNPNAWANFAGMQLTQSALTGVANEALGQGKFGDAMQSALYNILQASAFYSVGNMGFGSGSVANIAAHALTGGLLAEAMGGDFKTGAMAAGASEAMANVLTNGILSGNDEQAKRLQQAAAQIVGVLAAASVNGDVQMGADIAQNGRAYNHDLHEKDAEHFIKGAMEACQSNPEICNTGVDFSKLTDDDILAAMRVEGAHGEGIAGVKPEAIAFIDDFMFSLLPALREQLYSPTASEAERLDVEHKATLLLTVLSLGQGVRNIGNAVQGFETGAVAGVEAAKSGSEASKGAGGVVDDVAAVRPTPKQSEIDVGTDLGQGARPQVSYKNGQEVPYGTSGSVRPDWCIGNVCSVEVKNYNIATNQQGLISNVSKQALQRAENLPQGMQQQVVIDIRGQAVTDAQKNAVIKGIVQKSNGALGPTDIRFKAE